jgi:hypothetical protein
MHSLVLALLKQGLNPSVVAAQHTQRVQMPHHSANHTRDAGNRLKEDQPSQPLLLAHGILLDGFGGIHFVQCHGFVVLVPSDQVETPAEESDGGKSNPVRPAVTSAVGNFLCGSVSVGFFF